MEGVVAQADEVLHDGVKRGEAYGIVIEEATRFFLPISGQDLHGCAVKDDFFRMARVLREEKRVLRKGAVRARSFKGRFSGELIGKGQKNLFRQRLSFFTSRIIPR